MSAERKPQSHDNDYSYRGQSTKDFEKILSDYIGAYVVCTNTGTSALHIALMLSELSNTYIICPSITYVATANVIRYVNSSPVFCDVKDDLTIDPDKLSKYMKKNSKYIKAIIPVHTLGNPADMDYIMSIATKYGVIVIEDACQALGSFYHNAHCGTIGHFGAISFNGNKIITTGGGGALITHSKTKRDQAIHLSTVAKVMDEKQCYHDQVGYNYRMPSWNARLGISQFTSNQKLKELKEQSKYDDIVCNGWKKVSEYGDPIWTPLHLLPMYQDCKRTDCSNAERIGREVKIL